MEYCIWSLQRSRSGCFGTIKRLCCAVKETEIYYSINYVYFFPVTQFLMKSLELILLTCPGYPMMVLMVCDINSATSTLYGLYCE